MAQFYVQRTEEDRCRNAVITQKPITITGITFNGTVLEFTDVVRTVEKCKFIVRIYLRMTLGVHSLSFRPW